MKTIIIKEPGKVEIIEREMPVPQPGEALLKILRGGICGSDLGTYRGTFAYASYPRIPGHEFSAEIVEMNGDFPGLAKGMVVTCNPYFNCGKCYSCERALVNCCEHNETMGAQRDGAFSEYITMPFERIYDGKGLDPALLAAIEPFCISYHGAVTRGRAGKGDRVLVIGAGTIGALAAVAAKSQGATVYISDVAKKKMDYAVESFGLDGGIYNSGEDFAEKCLKATDGKGFDVAIEAVGLPSTFQGAIDAAAFGGRVVLIGVGKKNLDFNFTLLQKKELNVYGSRNALKQDFLSLIDLVRSGKVNLAKAITNTYALNDAPQAFKDFAEHGADMLKVEIDFTA
ncbi:MAG: zinc-binding alcohol dehydrogenase family protein [Succinivibrionaceae bacterium]|nr:zinc-binding alcohol dehydrogenase family protein [Succinivibrionaceae bacterium]